jgi:hypothetical protein
MAKSKQKQSFVSLKAFTINEEMPSSGCKSVDKRNPTFFQSFEQFRNESKYIMSVH